MKKSKSIIEIFHFWIKEKETLQRKVKYSIEKNDSYNAKKKEGERKRILKRMLKKETYMKKKSQRRKVVSCTQNTCSSIYRLRIFVKQKLVLHTKSILDFRLCRAALYS